MIQFMVKGVNFEVGSPAEARQVLVGLGFRFKSPAGYPRIERIRAQREIGDHTVWFIKQLADKVSITSADFESRISCPKALGGTIAGIRGDLKRAGFSNPEEVFITEHKYCYYKSHKIFRANERIKEAYEALCRLHPRDNERDGRRNAHN